MLSACGSGSDSESTKVNGWVSINKPGESGSAIIIDQAVASLEGETFLSPEGGMRTYTYCDCIGFGCLIFNPPCYEYTYYYSAITLTVTNLTTGMAGQRHILEKSSSGTANFWTASVPVTSGENLILVEAVDDIGNRGKAQIIIDNQGVTVPTVQHITPGDSTKAFINSPVAITFSEPMNTSTINQFTFRVSEGENLVPGEFSFRNDNKVAVFTPSVKFVLNTQYEVNLNSSITDVIGTELKSFASSFTTNDYMIEAPSGITAESGNGVIKLSWDHLSGVESYNIYFSTQPNIHFYTAQRISGITSPSFVHTGLKNGQTYYYLVSGVNADGENPDSEIVSATAGLFIKQIGTDWTEKGFGIGVDIYGNKYLTGYTSGDLANNATNTSSFHDFYLVKYGPTNKLIWTKQYDSGGFDEAYAIAVDLDGNSYLTGTTSGDFTGAGGSGYEVFIAKIDFNGEVIWIKQFGSTNTDVGYGVAFDPQGNSYITGITYGLIEPGGTDFPNIDSFVTKYDYFGNQLWIRQFSSMGITRSESISVDAYGNSYIVGATYGDMAGTGSEGDKDLFITSYNTSGDLNWTKQLGTNLEDHAMDVVVDDNGYGYVTGYTTGGLTLPESSGHDLLLLKFDPDGNILLVKQHESPTHTYGYGIDIDSSGNSYVTGQAFSDVILVQYDETGNLLLDKNFGYASGNDISVDHTGGISLTGTTWSDIDNDGVTSNSGYSDAFILHLYPE